MMTHAELLEIVEPLKPLTELQLYLKLDELKLPPGARDRVLAELEKQRQIDVLNRVVNEGGVPPGANVDDLIDSAIGLSRRK